MKKDGKKKENLKKGARKRITVPLVFIIFLFIAFLIFQNKTGKVEINVKTSLDKVVEKSDLETVDITYNVIAKKCKDETNCNEKSNDINDFKYVVSCKGRITAGIDFDKVKISVDDKNKIITVTIPEATIQGTPNIGSIKFLNGDEVSADTLPEARELCQETTILKSEKDNKLIPAAKEQARVVLEEFYKQWIKAYDDSYKVEIQ